MWSQISVLKYLDRTVMYRVVTHALVGLWVLTVYGSILGEIAFSVFEICASTAVAVSVALLVSYICGRIMHVPVQFESSFITALILFFLVMPGTDQDSLVSLALVTTLAITSKYIVVLRKQHVINPVVAGLVTSSFLGFGGAAWWVATPFLFLPIALLGGLVVSKVRNWPMVLVFVSGGFVAYVGQAMYLGSSIADVWSVYFLSYPALFLACFMLTEPFTVPATKRARYGYAAVVAMLANVPVLPASSIAVTPELALLLGNIIWYPSRLSQKLYLQLRSKREIAVSTFEFVFDKPDHMKFVAGQYMEWMLPHTAADTRGIRRCFTIASSPTEDSVILACKIPVESSSFKKALAALVPGEYIIASQRAGDFTLPHQSSRKIGYLAGGIGITPFRSQIQYMHDAPASAHDVVLLYGANTAAELAYYDFFLDAARALPLKLVPVLAKERADGVETGYIDADIIKRQAPDYLERAWYISGPPPFVRVTYRALRTLGVPRTAIVRDYFPGAV